MRRSVCSLLEGKRNWYKRTAEKGSNLWRSWRKQYSRLQRHWNLECRPAVRQTFRAPGRRSQILHSLLVQAWFLCLHHIPHILLPRSDLFCDENVHWASRESKPIEIRLLHVLTKYFGVHRSTTVAINWRMHTEKRPRFGHPENPAGPDLKGDLLYCKADRTIWWVFWESFIQSTLNVFSWLVTYGWLLTWLSFVVPCTWFCTRTFILQEVLGKPGIWKFYLSWTRSSPHRNLDVYSKTKSHAHEYIEVKILARPAAGFDKTSQRTMYAAGLLL